MDLEVTLAAANMRRLRNLLQRTDIAVPPAGSGRTKAHRERWSIYRWLSTYAHSQLVNYPLHLVKYERPDFILIHGYDVVGIEITEATVTDLQKIYAYPKRGNLIHAQSFEKEQALSRKQIAAIARGETQGKGWTADSAEREWVEFVSLSLERKSAKFSKEKFSKFKENWIILYENLSLPQLNMDKCVNMIDDVISKKGYTNKFGRIFIESNNIFWYFSSEKIRSDPVLDLWRNA